MVPQIPQSKTSPALIVIAVLAALQVVTGGTVLADVVGPNVAALIALILSAVQVAAAIILRGQVTPWDDVAAKVGPGGQLVAGPASNMVPGEVVTMTGGPADNSARRRRVPNDGPFTSQ